jgi:hypothetical protein
LARVGGFNGCRLLFDCRPVSDTDHTEDADVAFGDTEDVVLEKCAGSSWTEK